MLKIFLRVILGCRSGGDCERTILWKNVNLWLGLGALQNGFEAIGFISGAIGVEGGINQNSYQGIC